MNDNYHVNIEVIYPVFPPRNNYYSNDNNFIIKCLNDTELSVCNCWTDYELARVKHYVYRVDN